MKRTVKQKRVFIFGGNPASVMNSLAYGLKKEGWEVRGLVFMGSKYINYSELTVLDFKPGAGILRRLIRNVWYHYLVIRNLIWCDVIHVVWDCPYFLVYLSKLLGKRRVITFVGSEIRRPGVSLQYNPYYRLAYEDPAYEYRQLEDTNNSLVRQKKFSGNGFSIIVWDTFMYLDAGISGKSFILPHASMNSAAVAQQRAGGETVHIVHAPTAPVAKGSRFIIEAAERLKKRYSFVRFDVIQKVTNQEYQEIIAGCDIYIDQVIWGCYGVAAQQALQYGKVVVCYLNEAISSRIYPPDIPVQNATVDNLEAVLEKLVLDKAFRDDIAAKSTAYFEAMHSTASVAKKAIEVYLQ